MICYLESVDENNDKVYAYFNVRFDRLKNLMDKLTEAQPFDLSRHVTMVLSGHGDVTEDAREKLRRDYLFGEYNTHVRIFPPLQDVTGDKPTTHKTPPRRTGPYVEMTRFTSFQIGTLAVFGLEDETFIKGLAYKMTRLSDQPTKPVLSHMGEEVPPCPPDGKLDLESLPFHQLMFSAEEVRHLDKAFSIVRIFSHDSAGNPVYAYVNVRGDRIENLLKQGSNDNAFNVSQFSTLVANGEGFPTPDVEQKLLNDYLFGDDCLVVRIFPPLSDVT
ncbi:MAG: hypothetical protein D6711_18600 [Chloroflexi bacterium]|nr:MAG: hypothetical protein D6711_18600 [Chloroflexota bacterium]